MITPQNTAAWMPTIEEDGAQSTLCYGDDQASFDGRVGDLSELARQSFPAVNAQWQNPRDTRNDAFAVSEEEEQQIKCEAEQKSHPERVLAYR